MQRVISQLSYKTYDVAVIGGGIYGAWVAWDAALRGLAVALVDQGDFGNATSANSQKIVHGGLRYLQHADYKRMRESIRERSTLMRVAPHLVHPLPFLVPAYGLWQKSAMSVALRLNDLISFDRNRHLEPEKFIPGGRVISKADCLQLCPGLDQQGLSGGAIFYDGQVHNPDRLILSILWSATEAGADLANYARVTGFLRDENTITGLRAKDVLTGTLLEVRARVVVNCSGPWIDRVVGLLGSARAGKKMGLCKAIVLVTRPLLKEIAAGVPCRYPYRDDDAIINKGFRFFFITPWRNTSLIGTFYTPYDDDPDSFEVTGQDVEDSINEFNAAYPGADIKKQDVCFVYGGLLPRSGTGSKTNDIQYAKHYRIYDHKQEEGVQGLMSVMGVKYTTARDVAEKATDLVLRKLGRGPVPCRTNVTAVHGGAIARLNDFMACEIAKRPEELSEEVIQHLISTYGSEYQEILRYCVENPKWRAPVASASPVIKAEVLHGVRAEMAQKLGDVIFRRTELGTAGYPGDDCLKTCAMIMAEELGWDEARIEREIQEVRMVFTTRLGPNHEDR